MTVTSEAHEDEDPHGGTFASLHRQLSDPLDTRLAGQYSLPVGAPDLVGDRASVFEPPRGSQEAVDRRLTLESWTTRWLGIRDGSLHLQMSPRVQLALVIAFLCVDSSRYICGLWGLKGKRSPHSLAQSFVLMQSFVSLVSALVISGVWQGCEGLKAALNPRAALRWLPVAIGFSLAQACVWHAFTLGLGPATMVAVGQLYMPLSAIISRWLFRRAYGWLETHALALLTLSILAFSEMRSRAVDLREGSGGFGYALLSVGFSCLASLLSEWVLKPKYSARGDTVGPYFCVQKVRIEVWGTLTSMVVFYFIEGNLVVDFQNCLHEWDTRLWIGLAVGVAQGWLAGLVAKHLSTVAKAVIQCLTSLIVFFCADLVLYGKSVGSLPIALLAFVVALSALMYQIGRRNTVLQLHRSFVAAGPVDRTFSSSVATDPEAASRSILEDDAPRTRRRSDPYIVPDAQALAPREFRTHREERLAQWLPECPRLDLLDRTWLTRARAYNAQLADWASSRTGLASQLCCVVAFIIADAGRTLVYEWALDGTAIVQQSLVVVMSAVSIVIGVVLAAILDGWSGVRAALDMREAARYFPVSACFSLGTTCTVFAYGVGISAVQVTVIGYAYIPLSALLSRWIFKRRYGQLEWLALVLMVLSVSAFVLLQNSSGDSKLSVFGVSFVLVSVVLSCLASMLAEKIMKAGQRPFYVQNTSLQIGGTITAVIMLFVDGFLSSRPNDAFWRPRDIGGGVIASGIFVGWGPKALAALAATTTQSWLAGLVAKRLSTVTRSVVQCLELVIIYFVGDLVLKGLPFDWPVGSLAVAVALTVQVFAQAGRKPEEAPEEPRFATTNGHGASAAACIESENLSIATTRLPDNSYPSSSIAPPYGQEGSLLAAGDTIPEVDGALDGALDSGGGVGRQGGA